MNKWPREQCCIDHLDRNWVNMARPSLFYPLTIPHLSAHLANTNPSNSQRGRHRESRTCPLNTLKPDRAGFRHHRLNLSARFNEIISRFKFPLFADHHTTKDPHFLWLLKYVKPDCETRVCHRFDAFTLNKGVIRGEEGREGIDRCRRYTLSVREK